MHRRVLLGIAASVAGSVGHSLGMAMQKRAHMRLGAHAGPVGRRRQRQQVWRDGQWQAGLALYLLSSTGPPMLALSMLPVFVTAPLAAVGLVANAAFARWILATSFTRTDALGTLLVVVGSGCVALFGAIDEPPLSLDELLRLYRRPLYAGFIALFSLAVAALIGLELFWRRRHRRLDGRTAGRAGAEALASLLVSSAPAVVYDSDAESEPLLSPSPASYDAVTRATPTPPAADPHSVADAMYRDYFYAASEGLLPCEIKTAQAEQTARYASGALSAVISGLICSQTLLLAKSGIGLVVLTAKGDMQFNDPLALAIVAGLVGTALANLYYIQRALSLCSTLTAVPLCFCSSSLAALLSSLVYFDQVRLLTPLQIAMIAAGIVHLAAGVVLLSLKSETHDSPLCLPPEPASGD
ncbi:hypothetical protein LPJ61_001291 [Coemansia biformis]|uniref:Magnesium transporter n=1 Tax=Coemansia biformis TaxID=1286918 RepID=A0A9W8CZQ6_9FUNG|nr:hypothetical protein LPJ61_001291 [Coemansia biformis]